MRLIAWIQGNYRRMRGRLQYGKALKVYLYVSDTKVDQLFDQIEEGALAQLVGEIKLEFPGLSLSGKKNAVTRSPLAKLAIVERYLINAGQVGTVKEPKLFFYGVGEMKWGTSGDHGDLAFFSGMVQSESSKDGFVTLGGSAKHVMGAMKKTDRNYSPFIHLLSWLKDHTGDPVSSSKESWDQDFRRCFMVYQEFDSPPQALEFLAIKYLQGQLEGENALLGSPLYIAQYK